MSNLKLTNRVSNIFQDVSNRFRFLGFSGCRLTNSDVNVLSNICGPSVFELNVGHNSLHRSVENLLGVFKKCSNLQILSIDSTDLNNEDLDVVIGAIIHHLQSLRCINISEEMSPHLVWTPNSVLNKVLQPLLTSMPNLIFMFAPHREEVFQHMQEFFTTCPLSQNFLSVSFFFFLFNCRRARVEASELVKQIITLLGQVLIRANPPENSFND